MGPTVFLDFVVPHQPKQSSKSPWVGMATDRGRGGLNWNGAAPASFWVHPFPSSALEVGTRRKQSPPLQGPALLPSHHSPSLATAPNSRKKRRIAWGSWRKRERQHGRWPERDGNDAGRRPPAGWKARCAVDAAKNNSVGQLGSGSS